MAFITNITDSIKKANNWWVDYIFNPTINYFINPTINYVIKPCIFVFVRLWQFVILSGSVVIDLTVSFIEADTKARRNQQEADIEQYGRLVWWNRDLY